jgi:hypothetical protein
MPIAEAPKTGEILVTLEGSDLMAVAHWNPALARPRNGGWFMWGRDWTPTHWLWLPAPLLAFICHSHDPEGWARHVFCQILPLGDVLAEFADWFDLAAAAAL